MDKIREMKAIGRGYEITFCVDEKDYQTFRLWEYRWYRKIGRTTTYIRTNKKGERGKNILLHRLILKLPDFSSGVIVDHIDHNGLNNCRNNLRITDNSGNSHNSYKMKGTTSIYKGVSYKRGRRGSKPWVAYIHLLGKQKHLGYYETEIDAAKAYNEIAKKLSDLYLLNDLPK